MQISWQPAPLPADPRDCGHGVGICSGKGATRRLVAFTAGFGWLHEGSDPVVLFVPSLLPAEAAAAQALRDGFEAMLRAGETAGALPPGYHTVANC